MYRSLYKRFFSGVQGYPVFPRGTTFIEQFYNLRRLDTYKISRRNFNSLAPALVTCSELLDRHRSDGGYTLLEFVLDITI